MSFKNFIFVGVLLVGLFCGVSAVLAEKTPLQKLEEFEQKTGPKILVTEKVVLVERTQKGLIFIGDYDVLDKLKAIANVIGDHGVRVVEYRGLENGGVEVFFSIHPAKK